MNDALTAIQSIPIEPVYSAATMGLVSCGLIFGGVAVFVLAMSKSDSGPGEFVDDGIDESLLEQQSAHAKRMVAAALAGIGLLVAVFAIFTLTGLEGTVATESMAAESAAEEGDWKSAVESLDAACNTIQCGDYSSDVIVSPELQQQVATAFALALLARAHQLDTDGDTDGAAALTERANSVSSTEATLAAMTRMQVGQATKLEEAGKFQQAAKVFENADDYENATRLYAKAGNQEDLCRLYPNIPSFVKAGEACLKSGNAGRAGWYFKAGGAPLRAADAYLKSGLKQEGITILVEAGKLVEAAEAYVNWAKESDERAADRFLAASALHEELGDLEQSLATKRLAADAYARVADSTQSSTQRMAAWQLYRDLEDSENASTQMELAIAKASEFKSVGGLMELVRLNGEVGRGIDRVRGWADEALQRDEPHEAAQYMSLLLSSLMDKGATGNDDENPMAEEELAQMQAAMPALLSTNTRIMEKVQQYPTIQLKAFSMSTTFEDSGLQIHNHTTLEGTVTNPHDYPIEAISLRVILFEPRFDTEVQVDGWRKIMGEKGISEAEAREEWEKQTSAREKEMYSAPVGFRTDVDLGRIEPGQTIDVNEKLDSDVSYQFIDYYFVGMER